MTLAQLLALDPEAMWDALPRERQMAIIVPFLLSEFANVTAEDDGTDASDADQCEAARIEHRSFQEAVDAIEAAFPDIVKDDPTALYPGPTAAMFAGEGTVNVKGLDGPRKLYRTGGLGLHVRVGGSKVVIAGFKNLASDENPEWQAWTKADVDAERLRLHPEMADQQVAA